MDTLAEIEAALDSLTIKELETLRRRVDETLSVARRLEMLEKTGRPFPPPPDVPMEELKRIHALIEKEFSHVDS